jgi:hypothetical protein
MRIPGQSTNDYLIVRLRSKLETIDDLIILFNDLSSCKLRNVKQFLNAQKIQVYHTQLSVNQDNIDEIFYSYFSENGKIEQSPYLDMFITTFSSIQNIQYHIDYFKKYPIHTEKQLKFLCLKICLNHSNESEEMKELEKLYLDVYKNNPSLFSSNFVSSMINNEFFNDNLDKSLFEQKFIQTNEQLIKKFVQNHPTYITEQKQNKVIRFLLKVGYDKVLQNNIDMAQDLIIFYITNHFPSQAKTIEQVVSLNSHYLAKLIDKIQEDAKTHAYFSEKSIYHPSQIENLKLLYEKTYLDESLKEEQSKKKKFKL